MVKISSEEYLVFMKDFYANKYPNLRFGQAFLNKYYPEMKYPDLFYMQDSELAKTIIWQNFIEM